MLKRKTPLKSYSPLKSYTPMTKKRSKRAKAKEFSSTVRQIVLERSQGICEVCHSARIAHLHHAIFRSAQGTGDLENCIGVCLDCHEAAHTYKEVRERCVTLATQLAEGREIHA